MSLTIFRHKILALDSEMEEYYESPYEKSVFPQNCAIISPDSLNSYHNIWHNFIQSD